MKNLFFLAISILFLQSVVAQSTFRYQAVARDNAGNAITNQLIGLQISIIQNDITNPAIYEETHQVTSNEYGMINLNVGDGVPAIGDFSTLNWSFSTFMKVEMDITGGANYTVSGTSEILSVPRALYAETAGTLIGTNFGLYVTNFGAKGDASTDDTDAFEAAIDSAAVTGAKVFVPAGNYKITETLIIPDGVTLIGEGVGKDPLQTPSNGSAIRFEGNGFAFSMEGHTAGLRDMVIQDVSVGNAAGGVLIKADTRLIESLRFHNLLISNFTGGVGLELQAKNAGGIAYTSFYNIRVRNAKIGIHINEESGSFVNSNTFHHGAISGGGFDNALLVEGGNNNIFYGTVMEPLSSTIAHLWVKSGEIQGANIRIEGNNQTSGIPLIKFDDGTRNSILTGTYAGGLNIDKGNNLINMKSGKGIDFRNSSDNLLENATFGGLTNGTLPYWEVTGTNVTIESSAAELMPDHHVLKITIPAGVLAFLKPNNAGNPIIKNLKEYEQVNFGFHVKTSVQGKVATANQAPAGLTISQYHSGSGAWEFIGMNSFVNVNNPLDAKLLFDNSSGSTSLVVYVTTPTLVFGHELPTLEAKALRTNGGVLTGLLTSAFQETSSASFMVLPKTANIFQITNNQNIARINHSTADRFPKGSVITLLFDQANVTITNSGYVQLLTNYTSTVNSSITIISMGNGTWREISRNL